MPPYKNYVILAQILSVTALVKWGTGERDELCHKLSLILVKKYE